MVNAPKKLNVRKISVDPKSLKLLDLNARFMRHETYQRLVENIKADGVLTQLPLVWLLHDDETQKPYDTPVYEVLSGNHRTKASIDAELSEIDVLAIDDYLEPHRRSAIQLSHNSISGEDDLPTLKLIYEGIDDIGMKLYSGIDDKTLDLFKDVSIVPLSESGLRFQNITLAFLPSELPDIEEVWEYAVKSVAPNDEIWLAQFADYDKFMDAMERSNESYNIRNTAVALSVVLNVFWQNIESLQAGYLDEDSEPLRKGQRVPIDTVLNSISIPAKTASRLKKLVDKLVAQKVIENNGKDMVIDYLLDQLEELNSIGVKNGKK